MQLLDLQQSVIVHWQFQLGAEWALWVAYSAPPPSFDVLQQWLVRNHEGLVSWSKWLWFPINKILPSARVTNVSENPRGSRKQSFLARKHYIDVSCILLYKMCYAYWHVYTQSYISISNTYIINLVTYISWYVHKIQWVYPETFKYHYWTLPFISYPLTMSLGIMISRTDTTHTSGGVTCLYVTFSQHTGFRHGSVLNNTSYFSYPRTYKVRNILKCSGEF
jgi:hypothetical protein